MQRDPYAHLLSEKEKEHARNLHPRNIFAATCAQITGLYYMTRHNELHRILKMRISGDLIFGCAWRCGIAFIIGDTIGRHLF